MLIRVCCWLLDLVYCGFLYLWVDLVVCDLVWALVFAWIEFSILLWFVCTCWCCFRFVWVSCLRLFLVLISVNVV